MREFVLGPDNIISVVDDHLYDRISEERYYIYQNNRCFYAKSTKGPPTIHLHRRVMELEFGPSSLQVDHRDHDGLNNLLSNLRYVTPKQNNANRRHSRFCYVYVVKRDGIYSVFRKLNGEFLRIYQSDRLDSAWSVRTSLIAGKEVKQFRGSWVD